MKKRLIGFGCMVCAAALAVTAYAQQEIRNVDPSATGERQEQIRKYYERLKQFEAVEEQGKTSEGELIQGDDQAAPAAEGAAPAVSAQGTIFVQRIETTPSEALSEEELQGLIAPYENKELTVNDLRELVAKINELYRQKNLITARAFLSPQKIEGGVVVIKLIEGKIGDVTIEGNKSTRESFIQTRVGLKSGDVLNTARLEKDLEHFNSVYDIDAKVELKAGKDFGRTDAVVKVQEPRRYQLTTFVDNAGREDIGLYRFGALAADNSFLGFRDRLTLGMFLAEGTTSGSVAYDFPVNKQGTRFGASYDMNRIDVISGEFEVLEIDGDSSDIGVFADHPLIGRSDLNVNVFLNYDQKKTTTKFSDVTLVETTVNSFSYGGAARVIDQDGLWYLRGSLTNALSDLESDSNFLRTNADVSRYHILKNDCSLVLRASGQLSFDDMLPSSEQFQIGGLSTVRGYDEGLLIGERGYFLSAELNFPLTPKPNWRDKVQGTVFIDHGGIFPYRPAGADENNENDFITGAGGGIIINLSEYFSGRVVGAFPFNDPKGTSDGFKVHFYFQSILF